MEPAVNYAYIRTPWLKYNVVKGGLLWQLASGPNTALYNVLNYLSGTFSKQNKLKKSLITLNINVCYKNSNWICYLQFVFI